MSEQDSGRMLEHYYPDTFDVSECGNLLLELIASAAMEIDRTGEREYASVRRLSEVIDKTARQMADLSSLINRAAGGQDACAEQVPYVDHLGALVLSETMMEHLKDCSMLDARNSAPVLMSVAEELMNIDFLRTLDRGRLRAFCLTLSDQVKEYVKKSVESVPNLKFVPIVVGEDVGAIVRLNTQTYQPYQAQAS